MTQRSRSVLLPLFLIAALTVPTLGHADEANGRLELDVSWWGGLDILRDGHDVGPGFLSLALADTVSGSRNAERHASNATAWEATGLTLLATTLGLIVTDVIMSSGGQMWAFGLGDDPSDTSIGLGIGTIVGTISASIANRVSVSEVIAAVNAYNRDLDRGRLRVARN